MSPLKAIAKPAGLRKAWEHDHMGNDSTGSLLRRYRVPPEWGDPIDAEAWFDDGGNLKVCRALYGNRKLVTLKLKSRCSETTFSTARVVDIELLVKALAS